MNLFLWIHQSLSPLSPPWFINPHGIRATCNMKSRLAIKFPTPYEWWSVALPPRWEKASNGRDMLRGGGGGDVEASIWLIHNEPLNVIDPGLNTYMDYWSFFYPLQSQMRQQAINVMDLGLKTYIDYTLFFHPLPSQLSQWAAKYHRPRA